MKKYIVLLASCAFLAVSCEKAAFLDRKPYSTTTPENFYQNEAQFKQALIGCYEGLNGRVIGNGVSVTYGTFWQGLQWILACPSDEIFSTSTAVPYTMAQANILESDNGLVSLWNAYFNGIYRCNELLSRIDNLKTENKIQYEAETRFMRGFYYYHLALVFGGVPIVSFPSKGDEPRSSLEAVYGYIIADLKFAYDNLGTTGLIHPLSANKYTAAGYLARICNYLASCKRNNVGKEFLEKQPLNNFAWVKEDKMSADALAYATEIINDSPYILIDRYDLLFRETTKEDQYKECLFMADLPLTGTEGQWPASARMAAPVGSAVAPQVYGDVLIPNPLHFYLYSNKDPRRDHNFTCGNTGTVEAGTVIMEDIGGYRYPKPNLKRTTNATYKLLYDSDTQTYNPCVSKCYSAGKYRLVEKGVMQHPVSSHALSYPLLRLAEIYLIAAESKYFTSNKDATEARKYLRPVVMRAANNDENLCNELMTAYERPDFVDELLESRQRELIFEFSRKTDLIRYGRLDAAIKAVTPDCPVPQRILDQFPGKTFTPQSSIKKAITATQTNWKPYMIWAPLSRAQLINNPNLTQNAEW